jgi:ABC-type amino acid transport substrate-binding protein
MFYKITFLIIILISNLNARSIEEIKETGNIIIAIYEDFPPYSFIEDGIAKGIDIDLGKEIASSLGVKPIWYWTGSDESLDDDLRNVIWKGHLIHRTKADVMLRVPYDYEFIREKDTVTGQLSNEFVVMKAPYHAESWVIATDKKKISEVNSLAIFMYNTVAVELDTLPDAHFSSSFRGKLRANVKHYPSILNAIDDLKIGKVDAVAGLKSQLEHRLDYKNNQDKFFMTEKIDYVKSKWDIGIAVRHDFRPLGYEIEGLIEQYIKQGKLKQIFNKYNITYEKPTVLQNN